MTRRAKTVLLVPGAPTPDTHAAGHCARTALGAIRALTKASTKANPSTLPRSSASVRETNRVVQNIVKHAFIWNHLLICAAG